MPISQRGIYLSLDPESRTHILRGYIPALLRWLIYVNLRHTETRVELRRVGVVSNIRSGVYLITVYSQSESPLRPTLTLGPEINYITRERGLITKYRDLDGAVAFGGGGRV